MSFRVKVLAKSTAAASVEIDDVIDSWGSSSAKAIRNALRDTRECKTLDVYVNSAGGEVTEGLAIYNMLSSHPAAKAVTIGGIAASMASVICMAGTSIVMPKNSWMMIHNPWSAVMGDSDEMRHTADLLDKFRDQLARIYSERSGQPIVDVIAAMSAETWMSGDEAHALGYCSEVAEPTKIAARFDARRFTNAPKALQRAEPKGKKMDPQLLAALGLQDGATLEDVLAAVKLLVKAAPEPDADDANALAQARALALSNREAKRDAEIAAMRAELDSGKKDAIISANAKKFTPATEKLARAWPLAAIQAFVAEAPDLSEELTAPPVQETAVQLLAKRANAGVPTDAQLAVWKALGKDIASETEKIKKAAQS